MELVTLLQTIIICITVILLAKSIKSTLVSRSHLHLFNRKAEELFQKQRIAAANNRQEDQKRLDTIEKDIVALRNNQQWKK